MMELLVIAPYFSVHTEDERLLNFNIIAAGEEQQVCVSCVKHARELIKSLFEQEVIDVIIFDYLWDQIENFARVGFPYSPMDVASDIKLVQVGEELEKHESVLQQVVAVVNRQIGVPQPVTDEQIAAEAAKSSLSPEDFPENDQGLRQIH